MRIVILTGAGVSAESGLGTFRDKDGLWTRHDLNDVATPEGFARDPALVNDFYNARRANCLGAKPNAAHRAIAALQDAPGVSLTLVTQNIDDLHERGGARDVIHMHGEILRRRCHHCGVTAPERGALSPALVCDACGRRGGARPDVVWFGEIPMHMEAIEEALVMCELFVAIGTSGTVYPAAGFVALAREAGARTLEINLEPSEGARAFDDGIYGPAGEVVPAWVRETEF